MIAANDKELKLLGKSAAEFARKELAPDREENDKFPYGKFFDHVLDKAFTVDFFHTLLPESLSGVEQGVSALCILLDNLCQEDSSLAGIIFTNTAAQEIMLAAGADEALKAVIDAAKTVNNFLIALPVFNHPGDVAPTVTAVESAGRYLLSGQAEYVVLGGLAGQALIPAVLAGGKGASWFLVDLGQEKLDRGQPVNSLGLHACPAVDIRLNSEEGVLIGREGEAEACFTAMADKLHVAAAAMSTGIMKGALREALEYSRGRFQGGRPIIQWSEVQMILANMAVMTKNAEMIVSRACQAVDAREKGWEGCGRAAAIHVQGLACEVTTDGIQVLGGVGYMKDFGQEKRFRDAKHIQALLGMAPMKKIRYLAPLI